MVLDPSKVAVAVSSGLSIVCATCEKYWEARDKNVPDGRCLATDGCGSPIAGDTFHEYRGPMTQFDQFCFRCGAQATHAIRVNNSVRVIGCCSEHVEMVQTLKPAGQRAPNVVLISKDGEKHVREDDKPVKRLPIIKMRG
jgi:hypothetical protein